MKRFLIALLMMAVVLTGVFAVDGYKGEGASAASSEGVAQINITTSSKQEWPKFQLATKYGVDSNVTDNVVSGDSTTGTDAVLTVTTLADTEGTASVGFAINQISDSRTNDNYTLTVTATDLLLVEKADGTAVSFDAAHTSDQKFLLATGSATPAVTAATGATVTNIAPTNSGNVLTTHYNGKKVKANSAIELGTFTVTWTSNLDAEAGEYEAHIVLTVASI